MRGSRVNRALQVVYTKMLRGRKRQAAMAHKYIAKEHVLRSCT